jgi:hypothetical protein
VIPSGGVIAGADNGPRFVRGAKKKRGSVKEPGVVITEKGQKYVVVREDNWECLQRLAAEVGWRCFCVSGTVYIVTDQHLLNSQVRQKIFEGAWRTRS